MFPTNLWEGRYKSQALLDEAGLLTAIAYVDLCLFYAPAKQTYCPSLDINPIRASIANTPETSEYTSIYERIKIIKYNKMSSNAVKPNIPLHPFHVPHKQDEPSIPFQLTDYLELVDWSGRAIRDKKRGYIPNDLPNILHRLNIDPQAWKRAMQPGGNVFGRAMGQLDQLRLHANSLGQAWVRGHRHCKALFGHR